MSKIAADAVNASVDFTREALGWEMTETAFDDCGNAGYNGQGS
jgi:hypothetical protein